MFLSDKNIGKIFAGWDSNYPSSEIKCCQLGQLGAKWLQSTPLTSLTHLTFLTRSLRAACADPAYLAQLTNLTTTVMCTTSFHPPSENLRKILFRFGTRVVCSERICLHARAFLVALENRLGWPGESS